jgi:hypothetical protein
MSSEDLRRIVFRNLSVYWSSGVISDVASAALLAVLRPAIFVIHPFEIVICDSYPIDVLIDKLVAELSFRIILSEDFLEG